MGVRFESTSFHWPDGTPLAEELNLEVQTGAITALVGPSGCGKSTLLRLAAGLLEPTGGQVTRSADPCAFVFQAPTLLPWRSLRENVALPVELGASGDVDAALADVELAEHASKLPSQLSGGQQMRASLARALVTSPGLVLMDEPFAALDAITRRRVRDTFLDKLGGRTVLLVTHDVDEAVVLADRVVVLGGPPVGIRLDLHIELPRPRRVHDAGLGDLVRQLEGAL